MFLGKRQSFVFFLFLACSLPLGAAEKPSPASLQKTPAAKEKAAPSPTPVSIREVLLMSVKLGNQWVLSRMLPDGSCEQFLSQGKAFQGSAPTANRGDDFAPTASPDGKWMAFYSNRAGPVNLWISDSFGGGQHALTDDDSSVHDLGADESSPIQFSPDSKSLIFLKGGNLWICDLKTEALNSLTMDGGVEAFVFSFDGKWISYYRSGSLRRVTLSGQPDELLATNAANWPTLASSRQNDTLYYFYKGVWSIDIDTKKKKFLASSSKSPNKISVNPKSGDSLTFIKLTPDLHAEAYLVFPGKNAAGGDKPQTSELTQGGAANAFFSDDGASIYFQREDGLWVISTGGLQVNQLQPLPCLMASTGKLDYTLPPECAKP